MVAARKRHLAEGELSLSWKKVEFVPLFSTATRVDCPNYVPPYESGEGKNVRVDKIAQIAGEMFAYHLLRARCTDTRVSVATFSYANFA